MLTEKRHEIILEKLKEQSTITVTELVSLLDASESTIRRDLNTLHKSGLLKKIHGGATIISNTKFKEETTVNIKKELNFNTKQKLAKYAASLINDEDIVYIDAGTTTELIIDYINAKNVVFVTNGIVHAKKLIQNNFKTLILGGEVKLTTEAIIGIEAVNSLKKYNFTKGFFGTNGVTAERGYTTPDINESLVKTEAINRCNKSYVLCDESKFNENSFITFANIDDAIMIIPKCINNFKNFTNVMEVE